MLFKNIFCFTFLFYNVKAACYQYDIPTPSITAYKPRGLAISIPNDTGVELVIFYVSVNKDISNTAADYIQYVVAPIDEKWTFDNLAIKVKNYDVVYYKIFVQKYNRGYLHQGTPYLITERYKRPTSHPTPIHGGYDDCHETPSPQTSSTTTAPITQFISSTTPQPTTTTKNSDCSSSLQAVVKLLVDTQAELERAKSDLEIIKEIALTQPLYLRLTGPITATGDPKDIVEFVIHEKLNKQQSVKSATRSGNTITFELFSFDQKVDILRRAKKYLIDNANASITV